MAIGTASRLDFARRYLAAYAARDLAAVDALLAPEVALRDWKLRVVGKAAALAEALKNSDAQDRITAIRALIGRGDD